ncbi:MAG TPA: DUF3034 family protein [Armatimonadota bacterium]|jgi:hypothetical protein
MNTTVKSIQRGVLAAVIVVAAAAPALAGPPPLPLHGIEGYSGIFSTYTAYIANTPKKKGEAATPSVGATYVGLGHGRNLTALTITEAITPQFEIGYGWNRLDLGDLPDAIKAATNVTIGKSDVNLHNFNARYQVVKESKAGAPFRPAVTVGLHYKTNSDIQSIDDDLGGALSANHAAGKSGLDATVYATKLTVNGKTPVLWNLGLRSTKAAHLGLLGFTNKRKTVAEGSVDVFVKPNLILAAEFRQKPNSYTAIPGLVEREDNWFTLAAAYVANNTLTVSGGYGHFGHVLNHEANGSWGIAIKNEF